CFGGPLPSRAASRPAIGTPDGHIDRGRTYWYCAATRRTRRVGSGPVASSPFGHRPLPGRPGIGPGRFHFSSIMTLGVLVADRDPDGADAREAIHRDRCPKAPVWPLCNPTVYVHRLTWITVDKWANFVSPWRSRSGSVAPLWLQRCGLASVRLSQRPTGSSARRASR